MPIRVQAETTIERPRMEVSTFMLDPTNDPQWISGVQEASWVTPPPGGVGSRVRRVASFLGKRFVYELMIEAMEPGVELVMSAVAGPFPMRVTYRFTDVPEGTRVTLDLWGEATRFFGLTTYVLAPAVRRNLQNDLARLKALLEARP